MLRLRSAEEVGDVELSLSASASRKSSCSRSNAAGSIGLLPLFHQIDILGQVVLDRELVLRAAAGVLAGADDQRPVLRQQALAAAHRVLDQRRRGQIPEDFGAGCDALRFKPAGCGTRSVTSKFPLFKYQNAAAARSGLPPHTSCVRRL